MTVPADRYQTMRGLLRRAPMLAWPARALRLLIDPAFRNLWLLQRRKQAGLFQPSNLTWTDRYPAIFTFLGHVLVSREAPRILSFGCSTGEEVFTLAQYFPAAEIVGIDINPRNIAACQRALADQPNPRVAFRQAADLDAETPASFDAIFCLAVLRHGDLAAAMPDRCDPTLQFEDFERTIAGFARCLKPGGFLALWHCHFRLEDADTQGTFVPVMTLPARQGDPLYDRDNRRIARPGHEPAIFQKKTES